MRLSLTVLSCLLLLAAGCSDKATTPDPVVPQASNEMPTEVLEMLETNTPGEMQLAPSEEQSWPGWPDYEYAAHSNVYAVTFVWGQFPDGTTPDLNGTEWSGTLSVNGEALVHPRLALDFEPGEDYIVDENLPHLAEWVSMTAMDVDGISFVVFLRNDVTYITAPLLTFETEPITISYDFGELDKLFAFYPLEGGNFLAVVARKIWPQPCPGGYIEGTWIKGDNTGSHGTIEGIWIDYTGEPTGYINGQFTTTEDGRRELTGWVSGYYLDYIICEFKGTWWYDDPRLCPMPECGTGHGWLRARFVYADGSNRGGVMAAEFGDFMAVTADGLELPLQGFWHNFCGFDWADIRPDTDLDDRH